MLANREWLKVKWEEKLLTFIFIQKQRRKMKLKRHSLMSPVSPLPIPKLVRVTPKTVLERIEIPLDFSNIDKRI